MRLHKHILRYSLTVFVATLALVSCEDDYESDADDPSIPLTLASTGETLKAPGYGQYRLQRRLVDNAVTIRADLSSLGSVTALTVSKTINREADADFGTGGVVTLDPSSGGDGTVDYTYTLSDADVDNLVGLTFTAQTASGAHSSDLTLVVTLTPRENIARKKWAWTSRLWVDNGNSQDLKECEKDNYFLFNADSTLTVNYGADTGAGDCVFDGFDVYDQWHLTADEQYFIIKKHGLFDPTVKTDSFRVKTLTTEKLGLEIDIDLSIFGLSTEETFLYEYTAEPK